MAKGKDKSEKSRREYLNGNAWPLSVVTDSARSLQNLGRYYFDFLLKVGSSVGSYILSGLWLPGNLFEMFEKELHSITSTASFRILKLTVHNIVFSIIPFLRGEGPVFNLNEDNPLVRALYFLLRILYYVSMLIVLFILPTFFISVFILGIIYLNFGYGFAIISAGCIVSFTIINLATRFCLQKQNIHDPSDQKNAEAVKKILKSTHTGVCNLTDYVDSKMKEAESHSQTTNLLKTSISWHLSLFNFCDRIFQPLTELRPDIVPQEAKKK